MQALCLDKGFMRKIVVILVVGLLGVLTAQAQDTALSVQVAAVVDGGVIVKTPTGEIMIDVEGQVSNITWNDTGDQLAMLVFDEELDLYTADFDGNVTRLDTGALEVFPPTFTGDGNILYVEQGENRVLDPEIDYKVSLMEIAPEADAQPTKLGEFSMLLECDGGSTLPMEWQYWSEAGAFGNAMMLEETRIGILHSTTCGGTGFALYDLETGVDRVLAEGENVSRGVLSSDEQKLAAIRTAFNPPEHDRSLVLIDLATGGITDIETEYQPDQVTWGLDTAIYYSVRENLGNLLEMISPEEQAIVKKQAFNQEPDAQIDIPKYAVKIQQVDPAGQLPEVTVYESEAFAIGRMAATPDGLLFSQIANGEFWIRGVLDGTIVPQNQVASREAVPVTLYLLNLVGEEPEHIGQGMTGFVVGRN